jgi:tripartite-type tricarboxylate transporter receptor subunit TctC
MRPLIYQRRFTLKAIATAAVAASLTQHDKANAAWPDRPIKLIVPSAAGGSPDLWCRLLALELSKSFGQVVLVENKPGASGTIGMQDIVRAAPDGYTLGYGNVVTLAINRALFSKLPYEPETQLSSIAMIGFVQNAIVVRNDLGVSNVKELVALAKSKPGRLTMGSGGNGVSGHLGGELFKSMTGTYMVHVPYRGSPQALQDLMGGQVDFMLDNLSSVAPHIKAGRLKAIAVTGIRRSPLFPDIPTVAETGLSGFEVVGWGGIVGPAAMPRDLVIRLNSEINKVLTNQAVIEKYAALGVELTVGAPSSLFERARKETPIWADVVKRSGAKID